VSETRREFTTLPHGTYTFRAWGQDYAGNVAGPVEQTFTVRPAPWQTWWARLLVVALACFAAWGGVQTRLRALHHREHELQGLVDARTRQLKEANEVLVTLSYVDALTGVANRRRFEERLETEWKRGLRSGTALALVMIDIDHFKAYNDRWGHQQGDECLRMVATVLADGLPRSGDSVSRYGGEEFAVILPSTDLAGARSVAESLRTRVEGLRLPSAGTGTGAWVTISCGAASIVVSVDAEMQDLIKRADEALYLAKSAGRNRVATVEPPKTA
jgi:diguanylate cyclase (GGDEF)-like protein